MNGKKRFAEDFLYFALSMQITDQGLGDFNVVTHAVARLFLLFWGFDAEEVDNANTELFERIKGDSLGSPQEALDRLVSHVKKDEIAKDRFITQIAALASFDFQFTEVEKAIMGMLRNSFDLRPSESEDYLKKGFAISIGLNFFGNTYAEKSKK